MGWADGVYIGDAVTLSHYPLVIQRELPFLLPKPGHGSNVYGEMYQVSKYGLYKVLDSLEGHPDWYVRTRINVSCDGKPYSVWAYLLNERLLPAQWNRMPMLSKFRC